MPAKGHKKDCQCPICKRVRAKAPEKTAPKIVAVADEVQPVDFRMGQPVTLVTSPKNVPANLATFIEGQKGDQYKVVYRRTYFWVDGKDLIPR